MDSRKKFYDWLAQVIQFDGIVNVARDNSFDNPKFRSAGIRLTYTNRFDNPLGLKEAVLLETGFDDTQPNSRLTISSWAFDKAIASDIDILDNRAIDVPCYHPGYTLVEKLQAISTKFRKFSETGDFPMNFMRHYYDVNQLLSHPVVLTFIGTSEYQERKIKRFPRADNLVISDNEAFLVSNPQTRNRLIEAYEGSASLYYGDQPAFDKILDNIRKHFDRL